MLMTLQASGPYWDWPGPWHMMGGFGFWWIFPLLMMVFMVALCVFFMTRMPWGHSHGSHASSALEILSERFAKGEIPKEEFEEKRALLVRRV
jgi:putative membrane protein